MSLKKILNDRLDQLKHKKFMLPKYVNQGEKFLGNKKYTMDMLPLIEEEIEETKAAIKGIDRWKSSKKQKSKVLSTTGKPQHLEIKNS